MYCTVYVIFTTIHLIIKDIQSSEWFCYVVCENIHVMYWTFHFSDKQPPKSAETAQQEIEVDLNPGGGNAGDESLDNIV